MWIAIEGIDGAGKSSLINNLEKKLQNLKINFLITQEPGSTKLGQEIKNIIEKTEHHKNTEIFLFACDRAEHYQTIIKPALKNKQLIISDRSVFSSIAYQGYGYNYDINNIIIINKIACENNFPDLIIYLKILPEIALDRIKKNRRILTNFEKLDFLKKVSDGFDKIVAKENSLIIDALEDQTVIVEKIFNKLIDLKVFTQ